MSNKIYTLYIMVLLIILISFINHQNNNKINNIVKTILQINTQYNKQLDIQDSIIIELRTRTTILEMKMDSIYHGK